MASTCQDSKQARTGRSQDPRDALPGVHSAGFSREDGSEWRSPSNHSAILRFLKMVWVQDCDSSMLWAAACLCLYYFGLLRLGEIVVPSDSAFDEAIQLCMRDISVQSRTAPSVF